MAAPAPRRATPSPEEHAHRAGRIGAVDLFRGLTLSGVILVTSIQSFPEVRAVLRHAPWRGITIVDIGLPLMLFIVGLSAQLSVAGRRARGESDAAITRHAALRALLLFVLGIAGLTFPDFHLATIRLTGILQSIAITYFVATLLLLHTRLRAQVAVILAILLGYWLVLVFVRVPETGLRGSALFDRPGETIAAYIDRRLLGPHLNPNTRRWDTEGILPTISALSTVLIGSLTARWMQRERHEAERLAGLFAAGTLLGAAGFAWGWTYPVIKGLWTGSYVLVTAGAAMLALATCIWLAGTADGERWTRPFTALGRNALLIYGGFIALGGALTVWRITGGTGEAVPVRRVLYEVLFDSWLPTTDALVAYACASLAIWLAVAWLLDRRGIVLKV